MHYLLNQEQMERLKTICTTRPSGEMLNELENIKTFDDLDTSEGVNTLAKARAAKTAQTKAKIRAAIDTLRSQDKPLNAYQVRKASGVSYQSIKKHLNHILEQDK